MEVASTFFGLCFGGAPILNAGANITVGRPPGQESIWRGLEETKEPDKKTKMNMGRFEYFGNCLAGLSFCQNGE